MSTRTKRIPVLKTYKVFIGGKFPRTESGRHFQPTGPDGEGLGNLCRCSRKDFREAVVAARKGLGAWSGASAFLRGQVLYRVAEMLEGRTAQFEDELRRMGSPAREARAEVRQAVDCFVYYAGWTDEVQQIFSSVNPVSSSHFNFSMLEPTGVVSLIAPDESGLISLASTVAPILAGGNTCVALASTARPLCAVTFAEVLHASDVPAGSVNLLTGYRDELLPHFASHMDVNAMVYGGSSPEEIALAREAGAGNVKRVIIRRDIDWGKETSWDPYQVLDTMEIKTTWHPVGV